MNLGSDIKREIRKSLGLSESGVTKAQTLNEAYVVEPKSYALKTEFLSEKAKKARQDDFAEFAKALNSISAKLDTASREDADQYSSEFRSLKVDEAHCVNESYLRSRYFDNIDDPKSQLAMDTLTFMRLERDFGTFDAWQKDFIACSMSARAGYVATVYNILLKRFMNLVVDDGDKNIPMGSLPIVVIDVSEGAYYRDYVGDRKTYVIAMMKELNWSVIEERVKKAERVAKVMGS